MIGSSSNSLSLRETPSEAGWDIVDTHTFSLTPSDAVIDLSFVVASEGFQIPGDGELHSILLGAARSLSGPGFGVKGGALGTGSRAKPDNPSRSEVQFGASHQDGPGPLNRQRGRLELERFR